MQHAEHRHHVLDIGTEPDGDIFDIGYHIAGLVHLIDQIGADHAIARRLQRGGHLLGQMFAKRRLARQRRLEIIIAAGIAAAALHVLPVGPCRPRRRGGGLVLRVGVALIGKFEIRQLQQLDGLLKLRRHDQGLSLAKLESRC